LVFGETIETRLICVGRIGTGWLAVISNVDSSTALGVIWSAGKYFRRVRQASPVAGPPSLPGTESVAMVRLIAITTASAVRAVPSWNVTPGCSVNRHVVSST
jgi:hypothetical protein